MVTNNNPWRGLAPYQDPIEAKHTYKFCGRNSEILDLVTLIDNNLFVTLYGRTGVGKTSLLNAGVFPVLRKRGYHPIYIRLSQEATGKTYAEAIVNKIEESNLKRRVNIRTENLDPKSKNYLWHYFCTTKFKNEDGSDVYPVIVLDQFEEIFFSNKDKAELLLQQIYALLNDDLALPDIEGYSADTNYRFVASIREDNLFYLEDGIDELSLNIYKENRYRLRPLSYENAKAAIFEPGMGCIDSSTMDTIADKIIEVSKDEDGTISSLILSLVCSLMYEQAAKSNPENPIITDKQIPENRENTDRILLEFYVNNTTKKQRMIIEEELLTNDGHRQPANVPIPNCDKLLSKGTRILQKVETDTGEKVEIVHDRMAKVIYMHRRHRDSNKLRNLLRVVIALFLFFVGCIAINLAWTSSTDRYSPLAIKNYKFERCDTINYDDEQVKVHVDSWSLLKEIYIGENVSKMENLSIDKENIEIYVSPQNKHLKWDSIYVVSVFDPGFIGYLHYANSDSLQTVLYMQREPRSNQKLRLPKGTKELNYRGNKYRTAPGYPEYGETEIHLNDSFPTLSPFMNDKHIVSVKLNDVDKIPSYAFENCVSLKEVDLSRQDSIELGNKVFRGCYSLEHVKLPRKLKGYSYSVFDACYDLQSIELPEEVERLSFINTMFLWCPNIENITIPQNSHFHINPEDSIVYYDSIPVIFNKVIKKDWCLPDSSLYCSDGFLMEKNMGIFNYSPKLVSESANWAYYKNNLHIESENYHVVVKKNTSPKLFLPISKRSGAYLYLGRLDIKEIHTPIADPDNFSIKLPSGLEINKKDIVLYVPYGCIEAYDKSGKYKDYKDIREDSLTQKVFMTILYYWERTEFDYFRTAFGLSLLFFTFYKLRIKQMRNDGMITKSSALWAGIIGVITATLSYIPVRHIVYIFLTNHNLLIKTEFLRLVLSSICGGCSAYICSYLFVFSGKGKIKIWKSIKRITQSGI